MSDENDKKKDEAEERSAPEGSVVYEAIRHEGESELGRSTSALAWSGLAAGLSMGFSLVGKAVLKHHLPEAEWTPLLTNFGYAFGFLIVILGRQVAIIRQLGERERCVRRARLKKCIGEATVGRSSPQLRFS